MEYLKNYQSYNNDLVVEKLNLQPLLNKFKTSINKKSVSKLIVGTLLTALTIGQVFSFINSLDLLESDKKYLSEEVYKYRDPLSLNVSNNGIEHIKSHEKLKLKAYSIGDDMITVGYGHAEHIGKSQFKIGQTISNDLANKLFDADIKDAENGVKRIFKEWNEKGIFLKLTQSQFDSMISMTFNMGIGNLRTSDFIHELKSKNFNDAAELIKTTNVDNVNFPGLEKRRQLEYEMFIS